MEGSNKKIAVAAAVICAILLILAAWESGGSGQGNGGNNTLSEATRSRLVAIALGEFSAETNVSGCGEIYWSHWNKPAEPWCVDFLYYCADRIGLVGDTAAFGTYTADCLSAWYQLKDHGAVMYAVGELVPIAGDLVFWYTSCTGAPESVEDCTTLCHMGLVVDYDAEDGLLTTVEGNAGGNSPEETRIVKNTYADLTVEAWEGTSFWGFARLTSGTGDLTKMIKAFEGFSKYPVWDYAQYSVGYGTACPADKLQEYLEHGISEEAATALLEEHISLAVSSVDNWLTAEQLPLTTYQRDALASLTYNIGSSWMTDDTYAYFRSVLADPEVSEQELVQAFAVISKAGGETLYGLVERRICEAHLFLHGEYITDYTQSAYAYTVKDNTVTITEG